MTGRKDCNYKSLVSSEVCGSVQATLGDRHESQGVKACFSRSTTMRFPYTSQYLKFCYNETRDKKIPIPSTPNTNAQYPDIPIPFYAPYLVKHSS